MRNDYCRTISSSSDVNILEGFVLIKWRNDTKALFSTLRKINLATIPRYCLFL